MKKGLYSLADGPSRYRRALSYWYRDLLRDAASDLERARELRPKDPGVLALLSSVIADDADKEEIVTQNGALSQVDEFVRQLLDGSFDDLEKVAKSPKI